MLNTYRKIASTNNIQFLIRKSTFLCSCFHGWDGTNCDQCEALPGCLHGTCGDRPHTCQCEDTWEGILCDEPVCR